MVDVGLACNWVEGASILKNHLRDRLLLSVRNRQGGILHSKPHGELARLPVEGHGRAPARHADHLAIAPPHAVIPARAESLHGGLLGSEARGITLHPIRLGIAIANL